MPIIPVSLGERSYDIQLGTYTPEEVASLLVQAIGRTTGVAVLMDPSVQGPRSEKIVHDLNNAFPQTKQRLLPTGESCKTPTELEQTLEWLAISGFDRDAVIVCIGGGAASDHAGLAAAIYLRGIRFACCPTTLLAMADASVGGKTAVNLRAGKNLVGAFHQPLCVVADMNWLQTLPSRARIAGMAEVVKCALIADERAFRHMESSADEALKTLAGFEMPLESAIRIKARIVANDEQEQGERMHLNFGHTLGHAFEADSDFTLLHGEAVALGMIAALELGVRRQITDPTVLDRTTALLSRLELPTDWKSHMNTQVIARLQADKKRVGDSIKFIFIRHIGDPVIQEVSLKELLEDLSENT